MHPMTRRAVLALVVALTALHCTASGPSVTRIQVLTTVAQTTTPSATRRANESGCADGTREGFRNVAQFAAVAGCAGAWSVPGLHGAPQGQPTPCPGVRVHDTTRPRCARNAGNSLRDPFGQGCAASDLCAEGWHVCEGAVELTALLPSGCAGVLESNDPPALFLTRQSSNGCGVCALGQRTDDDCDSAGCTARCMPTARIANDLFGCGNFGASVPSSCGPLDRSTANLCEGLPGSPWRCDAPGPEDDQGLCEAYTITKESPTHGGVLCCRDRETS